VESLDIAANDLNDVKTIAEQLRVPELSYRMANNEELFGEVSSFFRNLMYVPSDDKPESAVKKLTGDLGKTALPVTLNNNAFISDRVFDVWGRKNRLSDDINSILATWRHSFLKVMYQSDNLTLLASFITLVDQISNDILGWEPRPERSKRITLDELSEISSLLFNLDCKDEQSINVLLARWGSFKEKQSSKALKVVQRLKVLEERQSWDEFCELYSNKYLNTLFSAQLVTEALQKFISIYWVKILSLSIEKHENPQIDEQIQTLTAKIKAVFCTKGKAALKWVDNLLDDMQTWSDKYQVEVDDQVWQDMQNDLVNILQGNQVEESKFVHDDNGWSKPKEEVLNSRVVRLQWFYSMQDSVEIREQVTDIYPETQEVLFCNYLGMKSKRYSFAELNLALNSQLIKPLAADSTFHEVVQKTSAGLLKVALTQKKARIIAAEKAQKEAEKLLAEKQHAEEMAKIKEEERAEKSKQLLKKRIDQRRAELENDAQAKVTNCKLGAWVSIINRDSEEDNKAQRFKLVVKFASSNKFIFVDKLGVKKIEYTEADLVEGVMKKDIEILTDGVEFEESLARVVSRLRTPNDGAS
jgi:hypothetical protein